MNHINNLSAESELSPKNSMLLRLGVSFGRLCGLNMAKKINGRLIAPKNSLIVRRRNIPLPPAGKHAPIVAHLYSLGALLLVDSTDDLPSTHSLKI